MLPDVIPIFPLPNVVLFPQVFLPLHVFEPRYRAMVSDVLEGDRIIGMTLLTPGWETDYEGRPAVFPIGCAGLVTHAERLDDGRFNIILRGLEKFRVIEEDTSKPYRLARVEALDEPSSRGLAALTDERRRLEHLIMTAGDNGEPVTPPAMPDEDFINALAQYLSFDALEKQALLETAGPLKRCRAVIELLEMKALGGHRDWIAQ